MGLTAKAFGNHCAYIFLKLQWTCLITTPCSRGINVSVFFWGVYTDIHYREMSVNLSVQAVQMCSWILQWLFYHSAFKKIRKLSSSLILSRLSTRIINPWDPLTVTSHVQMCGGSVNSPFQEDLKFHIFSLHLVKKQINTFCY